MQWKELLSEKRYRENPSRKKTVKGSDLRSEFEKDYHRIIGSASFRRLQDKTQVFPLDKSDFIRTRLTHSLEVSSFAKSLGQNIGENILRYHKNTGFLPRMKDDISNILQCAGLIHDIGNPPFGHFGETAIREWFRRNLGNYSLLGKPIDSILTDRMRQDLYHFEGNAQALRLVSKLHFLVDESGMNLTYALLNTIIKYPVSSVEIDPKGNNIKNKKMGYYLADEDIFNEITKETGTGNLRHPLTFILEAADDIAYKTADIEDAVIKGFLTYEKILGELEEMEARFKPPEESYFIPSRKFAELYRVGKERHAGDPQEYAIKNWIVRLQGFLIHCATFGFTNNYDAILNGEYSKDIFYGTFGEKIMDLLGDLAFREVFCSDAIYKMEVAEGTMLNFLMDRFIRAAVLYTADDKSMDTLDQRMISFISGNYKRAYHFHAQGKSEEEKLYLRLLLVTDYICGMTDSFAKRLYQELNALI
ncbi:MAG: deoxyguanosinetriphosphate triphosphohydrolase [Lachnospiraceae bacterium]|jgi:dGTPase|nr:deoxyguanosinetriphosphate triphosphohydrolase [Lachnospiraceae bacterium]